MPILGCHAHVRTIHVAQSWLNGLTRSVIPFTYWIVYTAWITAVGLVGVIFAIQFVELFDVESTNRDPFTRYDSILPGNSVQALDPYPCYFNENKVNGQRLLNEPTCAMFPQNEPFDMIFVAIRNKQIESVAFYATDIQLGQAALHWQGTVKLQVGRNKLGWNTSNYMVEVVGQNLCYKCAVRAITVTNRV